MAREVEEWFGRTDDSTPTQKVKDRILQRQGFCCAVTGAEFSARNPPEFDHIKPLILGGENRETNLQAICYRAHKAKSSGERSLQAKEERVRAKHLGFYRPRAVMAGSKASKWKKPLHGPAVLRNE